MADRSASEQVQRRARIAAWVSVAVIALCGVVVAIATAEWWPLVLLLGLALPMLPIGSARRSAR
ncbi:hypothetical protein [Agromyces sp. LHK192]|uniref:hypothetical protein n=1 Tax=Agromyces sp. LHK192 TaxID=2498704 RepID=UPI000FDC654A|nr:hypothetical protein [Agromyces sp. LHK192]